MNNRNKFAVLFFILAFVFFLVMVLVTKKAIASDFPQTEQEYNGTLIEKEPLTDTEIVQIGAGIISSFIIHEAGHYLTAKARGDDLDYSVGSFTQASCVTIDNPDCNMKPVALGGFGLQMITSHAILSTKTQSKYWRSIVIGNTIHSLAYIIRNELSDRGTGDFSFFDREEQRRLEGILIINALAVYYRWPIKTHGNRVLFIKEF